MRDAGRGTRDSGRCHRSGSTQGTGGKHGCGATARLPRDGRRHASGRASSRNRIIISYTPASRTTTRLRTRTEGQRSQRRSAVLAHTPDPPSLVPRPCKLASLKPEAWRPLRDVLTPAPHPLLRGRRATHPANRHSFRSQLDTNPWSARLSSPVSTGIYAHGRTDGWVGPRSAPAGDPLSDLQTRGLQVRMARAAPRRPRRAPGPWAGRRTAARSGCAARRLRAPNRSV
ncbi:hypothetical protein AcW1_001436 [Taiwanofungus camphoratus]|nr:hypothetical protein AcW1_001436 [Antrodia cinnamomea]